MKNKKFIGPVYKESEAFILANFYEKNSQSILYIGKDDIEINSVENKLKWLLPNDLIFNFRSWDQIPYDLVSPSKEIQLGRIKTLYYLNLIKKKKIVLTTINAVLQKTLYKDFILKNSFEIYANKKIKFKDLISKLLLLGYERTSVVRDKSEFAVRGSILDIYLIDHNQPIRLDFFDDVIETIHDFDRISQKRINKLSDKKFIIYPSCELLITDENIKIFRKKFREIFPNYRKSHIYNLFTENIIPSGGEQFLPLFNEKLSTLFEYLDDYSVFLNTDFNQIFETRLENINDYFNSRFTSNDNFYLNPEYLYLNKNLFNNFLEKKNIFQLNSFNNEKNIQTDTKIVSNLSSIRKIIDFNFINKFFEINSKIKKIIICCRSIGSLKRVNKILLENINLKPHLIDSIEGIYDHNILCTVLNLEESFEFNDIFYINEKTLFGYNFSLKKKFTNKRDFIFEELNKFTKNSILVHFDYGLCRFNDIIKINFNDSIHDCIELEFADTQKLYLPVENFNYVTKYGNDEDNLVTLDKLGASHWQRRKSEAKNKIKDAAKKLIKIASKRLQSKCYKIEINHTDYDKFCSTFPYIETEDQLSAIEDIIEDFKKNIPSDRLIVGDVAYGKTEVIIRAMFLAAKSNIQSIVIVPTTLLSRQHYENFLKRFEIFNIKIAEVSRLISQKEKNRIFAECKKGNIQILVGTHALLSDKLEFKKLGLIIYDEEQKLGTLQKEKLKNIAPKAHVIALSATPIPRTLSMSLSGIRDLSLILTAPFERLAVRSYVTPFDEITIKEAIKREIFGRKNSVFFVTPRKKHIPFIEKFIKEYLPEISYVITHGQLAPKILEERISKFYSQKVPLMISTNIIENGLDLPYVNTIIVYRSNMFSLASLYQLKGRVGRSSKRGYAYITFQEKELNENAKKRLSIINSANELGSGFNIASQDLDLRGGGSIIGEEQSGFIREIGTELYHQMLEEEIIRQKQQLSPEFKSPKTVFHPIIKIPEEIYIPENYIDDLDLRLSIYKRISNLQTVEAINSFQIELHDRFGEIPNEILNLFKLIELKLICLNNNIELLDFSRKGIVFGFFKNQPINPEKLLKLSFDQKTNFLLRPDQKLFYDFKGVLNDNRFDLAKKLINMFK